MRICCSVFIIMRDLDKTYLCFDAGHSSAEGVCVQPQLVTKAHLGDLHHMLDGARI